MPSLLTCVMYHYVRPLLASRFPRLKALELSQFRAQLDYLQQNYALISPNDLRAHLNEATPLPPRPCLLTFDDGYSDHFDHVFPELQKRGLKAVFFALYSSLVGRKMLEVNKIQFTLANVPQPEILAAELDTILMAQGLADPAPLRAAYLQPNRFDPPEVNYVKRVLQHALPQQARSVAVDLLFQRHVTADASSFAQNLYLTQDQARIMLSEGMEFGGHGDLHLWHARATKTELASEITGSQRTLAAIGAPVTGGFYSYPFGNEDAAVRAGVRAAGFGAAFTVEPALCDLTSADPLRIARLDTNDLPKDPGATGCPWLAQASFPAGSS
jgi:peptidoglycan/xylan/chitin deacetylase (PgdA/CDA1 family)